eukprot:gene14980-6135_t
MVKFFKEDTNCLEKEELKFKSGFVLHVKLIGHKVKAVVRASMKDKCYNVSLTVASEGGVSTSHCQCPKEKWTCSHMAAAAIFVNKRGFSKTDLLNSWIVRPKKFIELKPMSDLFPMPKPDYRSTWREVGGKTGLSFIKNFVKLGLRVLFSGYLVQNCHIFKPITC